jgi:hypothetical protein
MGGDPDVRKGKGSKPRGDSGAFADVLTKLVEGGITVDEPQLRLRVSEALDRVQRFDDDDNSIETGIDLPDLDEATNNEIVSENLHAVGPIIVAAMFEELKAFTVIDKLVELFQAGQLPIGSSAAGRILHQYWKESPTRMSESERRTSTPGRSEFRAATRQGRPTATSTTCGTGSFPRFHPTIARPTVDRQHQADAPVAAGHQQIRKAARDLAAHLSGHGHGMSRHAAVELEQQVKVMIMVLGDREIRSAFGAARHVAGDRRGGDA